jgi:signal transduction histidine kinase
VGNVAKHSEARKAVITLEYTSDYFAMTIEDDGKGFEVSRLTGVDERGRGSDLFGMKERTKLMGGACSIESQTGMGARINVVVPYTGGVEIAED